LRGAAAFIWASPCHCEANFGAIFSINGTVVSTFSDHNYPAGPIGIQTEGALTWWRNIRLRAE